MLDPKVSSFEGFHCSPVGKELIYNVISDIYNTESKPPSSNKHNQVHPTSITTDTQQQSGVYPYRPGDGTPYPPNPTDVAPYPPDIVPYPSDTGPTVPPPQLDTGEYASPEDSGGGADDD